MIKYYFLHFDLPQLKTKMVVDIPKYETSYVHESTNIQNRTLSTMLTETQNNIIKRYNNRF